MFCRLKYLGVLPEEEGSPKEWHTTPRRCLLSNSLVLPPEIGRGMTLAGLIETAGMIVHAVRSPQA